MKDTLLTRARSAQQEGTGSRESGVRGHLVELERTVAHWMKSEWFDDWLRLANQPHQDH